MSFAIGDTVGPYRITDRLGQGGMATVFRAYHAKLDRYVAIKVLHPAFKEDANFLTRFQREAQIVARLEHPHIVPIYDSNEHDGQPYLVMKFIEGQTLKGRLNDKPLSLPDTLNIMTAVSQALTYAHEQGILHRDIKPSNILLEKNITPYLADFGLARMVGAGESTLSRDMMLGTPQYISPEQAQGVKDLDGGTDIYSFGVVLYELLVGRVPFNGDTPYAIVHDHIFAPLPLPSSVNPQVPRAIEQVLLKALAKDRRDRYKSAVQMVDAFRQAIEEAHMAVSPAGSYRVPLPGAPYMSTNNTARDTAILPTSTPTPTPLMQTPSFLAGLSGSSSALNNTMLNNASISQAQSLTALRRREQLRRQRANLWIWGGFAGLIVTILAGVLVTVAAVTDPASNGGLFLAAPPATVRPASPRPSATRTPATTAPATGLIVALAGSITPSVPVTTQAAVTTQGATVSATASAQPTPSSTNGDATPSLDISTPPPAYTVPMVSSVSDAQALVDKDGSNPLNWFALAGAAANAKRPIKVASSLSKGVELAGDSPALLIAVARTFDTDKNYDLGLYLYAQALTYPDISKADYGMATHALYLHARNANANEESAFQSIMRAQPQLADGFTFGALASLHLGHLDAVNSEIAMAFQLAPNSGKVHLVQGILYVSQNQPDSAKTEFELARSALDAPKWVADEAAAFLKGP